jgi:hypothetical protein
LRRGLETLSLFSRPMCCPLSFFDVMSCSDVPVCDCASPTYYARNEEQFDHYCIFLAGP